MIKRLLANYWPHISLLLLSFLVTWPFFLPGYFSHHDDLQVMRIFEMRKCLEDFQIPCRWVPDLGFGNGFPLFNYYSVFPYYLGALLSYVFGFLISAKILFLIPLTFSGITMFFLSRELFGKLGGFTSGVLYTFAPYKALDSYVRGAVAESFALALIPLVFYFFLRIIKQEKFNAKYFLGLSLTLAAFLTSHNIMTIMFLPILFLWSIFFLTKFKFKNLLSLIVAVLIGFGISAFFILPAFFEKSLVRTDTLTQADLDFRVHFVTVNQLLFDRSWGYGASVLGFMDGISFQVGWPHWYLATLTFLLSIYLFIKKGKKFYFLLVILFFIVFIGGLFMTHNRSIFIWENLPLLYFSQFPWRFLSVVIFSASILGGALIKEINPRLKIVCLIIITLLTVLLNWSYFKPKEFYFDLTDTKKLSGDLWEEQQRASILDYLPKDTIEPREPAPNLPIIHSGQTEIKNFTNNSNNFTANFKVSESSIIEFPVFDFPNWRVYINNNSYPHNNQNYLKRIQINLPPGDYEVMGKLENTPIRSFSNVITLLSIVVLLLLYRYGKNLKIS